MAKTILFPDVLIIGAGAGGCPLALALHRKGLDVLIVERTSAPKHSLFKGEYVQPKAVRLYEHYGLGSIFSCKSAEKVRELHFSDLGAGGELSCDLLMSYPKGFYAQSIRHSDLISGLHQLVHEELGAEKFWRQTNLCPTNAEDPEFIHSPEFKLSHPLQGEVLVRPKWTVGADGRQSTVRKWIHGREVPKNDRVVFGAGKEFIFGMEIAGRAPKPNRYEVMRSFGEGTLSVFALGGEGQRIYFSSPPLQGAIGSIVEKNVRKLLCQLNRIAKVGELPEGINLVSGFPAQTSFLGPAASGKILLIGDAAAVTTPFGGQGITAVMEHVEYLVNNFNWAAEGEKELRQQRNLYRAYVQNVFARINRLNFWLYLLFFSRRRRFKFVTKAVLKHWNKNPEIPQAVMNLFGGLNPVKPSVYDVLTIAGFSPKAVVKKALHSFS